MYLTKLASDYKKQKVLTFECFDHHLTGLNIDSWVFWLPFDRPYLPFYGYGFMFFFSSTFGFL